MLRYFSNVFYFIFPASCLLLGFSKGTEVLRPRGVDLSKKVFYVPDQDFSCIDGSRVIPFSFVNDDYCDCEDGSDEPGTSACPNAMFHCINSGHISMNIPSSRVNDNICDCCDGGDEYNSTADCINTCFELGRQAREEEQKQQEMFERGFAMYQQYAVKGKEIKKDNEIQLQQLKVNLVEEEINKEQKEAIKKDAEELEKSVLAVYKSQKEEEQKKFEEEEILRHQEKDAEDAEDAFKKLDVNNDNVLTVEELQRFGMFDNNKDGIVSEEEAKFFLHMKDSMDLNEFKTTAWMIMKPVFMLDKEQETNPSVTQTEVTEAEPSVAEREEESDDETYQDIDNPVEDDAELLDEDDYKEPPVFPPKEEKQLDVPEYDEETQKIVDLANNARKDYTEAVESVEKLKTQIKQLESDIESDFGKEEEFAFLKGECFDFDDREYTYRFCPFDKASQIAKSGGSDVNLGKWGHWAGPENDKYSKMKYHNGQMCWNGPTRSVMVLLQCGLENKLLSSSEPNRCEYLFEFSTPALCSMHKESSTVHQHIEL